MKMKFRLMIGLMLFCGVMAMTVKYVNLLANGPVSELLLEESNERFKLRFYGEKVLAVSVIEGNAKGPKMLNSKGDLVRVFSDLNPDLTVINETNDETIYTVDIKFHVPREEVLDEINQLLLNTLGYKTRTKILEKPVFLLSVSDLGKTQRISEENLPAGALEYSNNRHNRWDFYGYTLAQTLEKINYAKEELLFYPEYNDDTRIGIELSDINDIEKIIKEFKAQGLNVSSGHKSFKAKVIVK